MNKTSFFKSFNSEFEKQLPKTKTYSDAFDAASNYFRESVGEAPYMNWDSFKSVRSRRKKAQR